MSKRNATSKKLRFTKTYTEEQRLLTIALLNMFDLVPACVVPDAYYQACHHEYYIKHHEDVVFQILMEEKQEELRAFMAAYGKNRRQKKVNSFDVQLTLFVD